MNIEIREYVLHLVETGHFDGYTVDEYEAELEDTECLNSSESYPSPLGSVS